MTEPKPPDQHDDRELDEFLARRDELSRRYREAAGEGAPPQLDAAILQRASEELRRTRPLRRWQRWSRPLAVAASLMLVVSLAWTVRMQQQDRIAAMARAEVVSPPLARVSDNVPAPAAAPAVAAAVPAVEAPAAPEGEAKPEARPALKPGPGPEPKPEPRPELRPGPTPETDRLAKTAPPTTAYEMWKQAREQQQSPPPAARHPAFAGRLDNAAPAQDAPEPQSYAPPAPTLAPAPPPPAMLATGAAAAAPAPAPDPCASTRRDAAQLQAAPEHGTDAAAWLEQIRHLRDAPDEDAARAELACFVAARPQESVPDDLKSLLVK